MTAGFAADAGHDLGGVAQIRHRLGRHERGRLDLRDAGGGQQIDQFDLALGGNETRFDLQPVARDDVVDEYAFGHDASYIAPDARNRSMSAAL